MTPVRRANALRAKWILSLLLVHFFIVPCASAMILMPAEADCEHCHSLDTQDPCLVNSSAGFAADSLLIDGGRPDAPRLLPMLLLPASVLLAPATSLASGAGTADAATWHSGDPPPYLRLGQLRL